MRLAAILAVVSLIAMILIDRAMGPKAEFLNAWSVVERLLGRDPSAGISLVAQKYGAVAELAAVLLANAAVGAVLATLVRLAGKVLK